MPTPNIGITIVATGYYKDMGPTKCPECEYGIPHMNSWRYGWPEKKSDGRWLFTCPHCMCKWTQHKQMKGSK